MAFVKGFEDVLDVNKIQHKRVQSVEEPKFWDEIQKAKLYISRYKGHEADLARMHALLPEIERKGVKTLPNFNTVYHCGDKLRLAWFYGANNISTPRTFCAFSEEDIVEWKSINHSYPIIVKLRRGAGSRNVAMAMDEKQLDRVVKKIFKKGILDSSLEFEVQGKLASVIDAVLSPSKTKCKNLLQYFKESISYGQDIENTCLILQEYLPNNEHDTRITVVGDRAFGFVRKNRKGDFRASGSGMIEYDPSKIDEKFVSMALDISTAFKFQTMAYDFIYDQNGNPSLIEMNYTYVDTAVKACPGFWRHDGRFYQNKGRTPQYWQLVDALEDENLKFNC